MSPWITAFVVALIVSAIGFKKYVWFISIGYGYAVAAIGVLLLCMFGGEADAGQIAVCVLFVLYGLRLGGFLTYRELKKASYNNKMKTEIKSGKGMSIIAKCGIWISAALLYACETSPVIFRLENGNATDGWLITGVIIMAIGLITETSADVQKSKAKQVRPGRFVDTGLYRLVRCPNYLGEMTFWTGVFITGITSNAGALQWISALAGYIGIIYVMFGGARRLEMRQDRTYKDDPEYWAYKNKTPIMIPFIPLYSVEKYKWLVA